MVNVDDKTCCSQFSITISACPHLDGKNVVFGEVKKGLGVVQEVNYIDTQEGRPIVVMYFVHVTFLCLNTKLISHCM
jgi:cyclophilin family peptidyl-prolyl cis-trans isomerase